MTKKPYSLRDLEELYKVADEELRGFLIKKAEDIGIEEEHFLKRVNKIPCSELDNLKFAQALPVLDSISKGEEFKKLGELLPTHRVTFDTATKSYKVEKVYGKRKEKKDATK